MNNYKIHVNMTEFNILIFSSILLVIHLASCQPNTLNLIWSTLETHCMTGNDSRVRLNNTINFGSPTEFLIQPIWSSIDGNNTYWILYLGCVDIDIIPISQREHHHDVGFKNDIEGCYLECQQENISCGQNEPIYFALQNSLCFCFCKNQEFLSRSRKCNESCNSKGECITENYRVYTKYAMKYKISDGFCLVCSKANKNLDAYLSVFGCDGEHFGLCVDRKEMCFGIKEENGINYSNIDCAQQLPFVCLRNNEVTTNIQTLEVTLTTAEQSSEDTTASVVYSSEDTSTITVQSSELSSKYTHEVPSLIPLLNFSTPFDKAAMSSFDTVGTIVGCFVATFSLGSMVFLVWFYRKKQTQKLRESHIDHQQPHTSHIVTNTYTDKMLVSGDNQTQNDVTFTTTTNAVQIEDIYVENEEGEYDHLHSSRPKQVVSEREDERYATSTQLEDVSYSTVRKSRKYVPDCDNEYDSIAASFHNNCRSVANPDYDFCYQSS